MSSVTVRPTPGHAGHPAHPHVEDPKVVGGRWRTGVFLLIFADVAFVAAVLFSYLYLRGLDTSHAWLAPKQQTAQIWVGWLIAAILIASAIAYRVGSVGISRGARATLLAGAGIGVLLVVADTVVQIVQLSSLPFGAGDSAYSSEIYMLGGANLFHLLLTLFIGLGVWNRTRLGLYDTDDHRQVKIIGFWWTWIAVAATATALVTSFIGSPKG